MGQKRQIREGVRDLLAQLGGDVETITTKLWASGVRGTPNNAEDCVLARYLNAVVGGDRAIVRLRVWRGSVRIELASLRTRPIIVSLPLPLQRFVAEFDKKTIPDLIDTVQAHVPGPSEPTPTPILDDSPTPLHTPMSGGGTDHISN